MQKKKMGKSRKKSRTEERVDQLLEREGQLDDEQDEGLDELTAQPSGVAEGVEEGEVSREDVSPERLSLREAGERLQVLCGDGELDEGEVRRLRVRSVVAGEELRVGEGILESVEAGEVQAGRHVKEMEDGLFQTRRYGYLCLQDGRLNLFSPLRVDADRMEVHWLLLDDEERSLTAQMLLECLGDQGVENGIRKEEIERVVDQVTAGGHECGAVLVAVGKEPEHGQDGLVQMVVELREMEEGVEESEPSVREGQVIARHRLATKGVAGLDVYGAELEARDGRAQNLEVGANVRVERKGNLEMLRAEIAGAVRRQGDELSVVKVLQIAGSVGFDTGNLEFAGQVCIEGSVAKGFSVKADDRIVIAGAIEPGATVQGKVVEIGGGVLGPRTRVVAGGTVRAPFVDEGTVIANGAIQLSEYASKATLVAGGEVRIARGEGERGGSLLGGEAWGRRGVSLHAAGSRGGIPTTLAVGLVPQQGAKLDKLGEGLTTSYNQLMRYLERFGMTRVDLNQIKNLIAAAAGPRRKLLMSNFERLRKIVQLYRKLATSQKQLREQIGKYVHKAEIEITGQLFPGVSIRVGETVHQVEEGREGPLRFRLVDGELVDGSEGEGEGEGETEKGEETA